jgi:hypothetical protein
MLVPRNRGRNPRPDRRDTLPDPKIHHESLQSRRPPSLFLTISQTSTRQTKRTRRSLPSPSRHIRRQWPPPPPFPLYRRLYIQRPRHRPLLFHPTRKHHPQECAHIYPRTKPLLKCPLPRYDRPRYMVVRACGVMG